MVNKWSLSSFPDHGIEQQRIFLVVVASRIYRGTEVITVVVADLVLLVFLPVQYIPVIQRQGIINGIDIQVVATPGRTVVGLVKQLGSFIKRCGQRPGGTKHYLLLSLAQVLFHFQDITVPEPWNDQ